MNIWTSAVIPACVSLAVAGITHPVVVKMQNSHEEKMLRQEIRKDKLHNWKVYISNLLYEFPAHLDGFRSQTTYKDIEIELPKTLRKRVRALVLIEDYLHDVPEAEYLENMRQIRAALEEILEFLSKLGKDWKVQ